MASSWDIPVILLFLLRYAACAIGKGAQYDGATAPA